MVRIAVCDDFEEDRRVLSQMMEKHFAEIDMSYKITEFEMCEDVAAEYQDFGNSFDLIFLDVYTGKMNGFEAAKIVRGFDKKVPIVFATNSLEDAVHGYDVGASGYLLKPIKKDKFLDVINRLNLGTLVNDKEILLKVKSGYHNFKYDEFSHFESNRNIVNIHTVDNHEYTYYGKLSDLEARLNDPRFLRCHQSYLVNMNYISEAEDSFEMKNGAVVPIKVRGRKEIIDKYCLYFLDQSISKTFAAVENPFF